MTNYYRPTYPDIFYQIRKRRGKDEHYYTGKLWKKEKGSEFLEEGFNLFMQGKTVGEN